MSPRQPAISLPADGTWVLVKGWHDSGNIEAVYGPYTEERARWLVSNLIENSNYNWNLIELQREPS